MTFSPVCALIQVSCWNRIARDSAHFGFFFLDLPEFLTNAEHKKKKEKIKERASYVAKIARKTAVRSSDDLSLKLHKAKHEFPIV